jgi:hypothetical protein
VDQGDVVVRADDIAEGGEALFDALDFDGVWKRVAQVLQFLVRCGGRDKETFAVAVCGRVWLASLRHIKHHIPIYPAVNLPTILVPAIVAWQMGITSCNSASNML